MSDHVVYKYKVGAAEVTVPAGDVVLVAAQRPMDSFPTVWIEHDPATAETMTLAVIGTGHPIEADHLTHVGSAVCALGDLVWHVYEVAS